MDIENLNIKMERLNFQIQGIASIKEYPSKISKIARTYTTQFKTQSVTNHFLVSHIRQITKLKSIYKKQHQ